MQQLHITTEKIPNKNAYLISLEGDFDGYVEENIQEIDLLIRGSEEKTSFVFDFTKLNYMNSFAIGNLVQWRNQIIAKDGKLFILGINNEIKDALNIVGGSILFVFLDNLETALNAI
ncbi:STAS domain-containing protein [Candidatus Peregrinibacteria bacterium]|nr:STAS domain-containing protein [Candidatus Peregrinibacteria bacterium]